MARLGGDDGPKAVLYSEHRKRAQSLIFIAVTSTPSHVHKGRLTRDQPHLRLCPDTASSCRRYTLLQPPRRGHIRQPAPGRPGYHPRPEYPPPKRLVASMHVRPHHHVWLRRVIASPSMLVVFLSSSWRLRGSMSAQPLGGRSSGSGPGQ